MTGSIIFRWVSWTALVVGSVGGVQRAFAARPKVVATISIIGDWAREVGGDDIELTTLVGPDGDPHEYKPVPADGIKIAEADAILENGFGLESWLDKLCESAQTKANRVVLTKGIDARRVPAPHGMRAIASADDCDPHAWQNVKNAVVMVDHLSDAFAAADPEHATLYKERAAVYESRLKSLDSKIADDIESIPKEHRKLVTSHDAFGYFGVRYGLDISRSALESFTTEAADPSARQIADVVEQIKSSGVSVIFLENVQNPKLMNQIASEAGVRVGPPLYSDALGKPGTDGDTYLKMMKYNAETLMNALK